MFPRPRPDAPGSLISIRLADEGLAYIDELAAEETGSNRYDMIRQLLAEAVTARQQKRRRSP